MSEPNSSEVPLVCPACDCRLFEAVFVGSRYLLTNCYQCNEGLMFAISLAMPVEAIGPHLVESPSARSEPEAGGLLTLSVKGTGEEAILAAEQHGISITVTHEVRRPRGSGYCEGLASATYGDDIQRWYAGQDHSRPYLPGALLWWRPAESKEVVTR